MKKLFFAAALAIVAVGGALTANAVTIYPQNTSTKLECLPTPAAACSTFTVAYTGPNNTGAIVPYSSYSSLYFQ